MKRNIKTVVITIPCEQRLNRIKNTFAINTLFYPEVLNTLTVGSNGVSVNHASYNQLVNMQGNLYTISAK